MNLRPHARDEPDVSLTPLIDVVFLLLIFFMVSTTFRKESEFKIDLPEATQKPQAAETAQLEIAIDIDGRFAVNERLLSGTDVESLMLLLEEVAGAERDQPLLIRADAKTTHQSVVTAMDAAGRLGFRRLGIVKVLKAPDDR